MYQLQKFTEISRNLKRKVKKKKQLKEDLQKLFDLKRSYDIDMDSSSPPRTMSISAWPNDEEVKIDTFQLHFTEDHFSLRCCNIQLTRASIRPRPFGRGTTHVAYWIKLASEPKVMKVSKGPIMSKGCENDKEYCMQDITSQLYARGVAKAFNETQLVGKWKEKVVEFAPVQLLCFYQRTPQVYMTVEPAIEGIWKKYDNATARVDGEKHALVQAFSHFSYEYSQKRTIVTNLQGAKIQNKYTFSDPTVHCVLNDDSFGPGNQGQAGIDEFFKTHACNKICQSLELPQHPLQPEEGTQVIS